VADGIAIPGLTHARIVAAFRRTMRASPLISEKITTAGRDSTSPGHWP
jgi:hypothetical protein